MSKLSPKYRGRVLCGKANTLNKQQRVWQRPVLLSIWSWGHCFGSSSHCILGPAIAGPEVLPDVSMLHSTSMRVMGGYILGHLNCKLPLIRSVQLTYTDGMLERF